MADGERTFTETEHFALLTDAVARETASLVSVKEELESSVEELKAEKAEEITTLQSQLDVLAAEKAAAEKAATDVAAEFEAFKSGLTEMASIEARRAERVEAVKAQLTDVEEDYFAERAQRWAEMSEESFAALLADLTEMAAKKKKPAFLDKEDVKDGGKDEDSEKAARETAAFAGGQSPTSIESGSLFGRFLQATGKLPAASN